MPELFQPLILPNGSQIPNRLCKAAMEENLADAEQVPGERLFTLYRRWSSGGVGLILTGNVMVAPNALTGPGGVVLQKGQDLSPFRQWSSAAKSEGAVVWVQLNHPGRQVYASMGEEAVAPSAIGVNIPGFSSLFPQPRALENAEIESIINQFAESAVLAEQAGFDGCQIHAAHGYLLSQFLSPLTNQRQDQWGGSVANRARLLFEVVNAVRAKVGKQFSVSVKLNSADFQKGGFDQDDAHWVVEQLNTMFVDLVELSGGSYESPAMQGSAMEKKSATQNDVVKRSSSHAREAYFIDFARQIASVATMPIMVTGGIRKKHVAIDALQANAAGFSVDMLGIARAMAIKPDLPKAWRANESLEVDLPKVTWKNKTLAALAMMAMTKDQLTRLAHGKDAKPSVNPVLAIIKDRVKTKRRTSRYRRWRDAAR